MKKQRMIATEIKVRFNKHTVVLADQNDRKTTREGVEIYMELKPGGEMRPIAVIPDGTLDRYKHCRPEVIKVQWVELL